MEKELEAGKPNEVLDKFLDKEKENKTKIIDYLNKLITLVDGKYAYLINQAAKDIPFLYYIIKSKLQDLKNVLMEEYSLEHFCLMIYELLFIGQTSFNYDDFESKSYAFELVLNILNNDVSTINKEPIYINEVKNKKNEWKSLIDYISLILPGFTLILCMFLKYFEKNEQIIQFLIELLQGLKSFTIKINFNLEDLNDMSENCIAEDFIKILSDNTGYFELAYENGHIIKKLSTEEEKIKEEEQVNIYLNEKNEDLIRKNPNILTKYKNDNNSKYDINDNNISDKEKAQKTSNENQAIKINLTSETKIKTKEQKKKDKNIGKIKEDESQMNQAKKESKSENENASIKSDKYDILLEEIQKLKMLISTQADEIKSQADEIKSQANEIRELKNENKLQKNSLLRTKENHIKSDKKTQEKINKLEGTLNDVRYELNLIKSRDAIKSFINYFYKGFSLDGEIDFRDKASRILERFNKYNDFNQNDIILANTLRILIKKGADLLYKGNDLAHEISNSNTWLLELFKIIEPCNKYENIINKFSLVKADYIIMRSIQNRHINYKDKTKLEECEKVIFSQVSEKDISTILMK